MSYSNLTSEERYVISHLVLYGLSLRELGRRLKRHHTTISREIKRHYLLTAKLSDKTAEIMTIASAKAFRSVPKEMRKTLTVDNGKEFAYFKQLEKKTGLSIYFADPYSAWQRGSNENTNGLIRQYFPKGTIFKDVTNKDLALVVKNLNYRPRKSLNY